MICISCESQQEAKKTHLALEGVVLDEEQALSKQHLQLLDKDVLRVVDAHKELDDVASFAFSEVCGQGGHESGVERGHAQGRDAPSGASTGSGVHLGSLKFSASSRASWSGRASVEDNSATNSLPSSMSDVTMQRIVSSRALDPAKHVRSLREKGAQGREGTGGTGGSGPRRG